MSFETRALFPFARIIFCAMGVVLFLAFVLALIICASSYAGSRATPTVHVQPRDVLKFLEPFEAGQKKGSSSSSKEQPFETAISPTQELAAMFPSARIADLLNLLPDEASSKEGAKAIGELLSESEMRGDKIDLYVSNAIDLLRQVQDVKMRLKALELYHSKRLQALSSKNEERKERALLVYPTLAVAGTSLLCLLLISLLLAILAVEKNTRPATTQ